MREIIKYVSIDGEEHSTQEKASTYSMDYALKTLKTLLEGAGCESAYTVATKFIDRCFTKDYEATECLKDFESVLKWLKDADTTSLDKDDEE